MADAPQETPSAEESGNGLEKALHSGLRVAELYARTLALFLPWRLFRHLLEPVPAANTSEQSRYLGPLSFLAVTWLISSALNNLLLFRFFAAKVSGADLPTLLGHGVPLADLVIWTLPLMLLVGGCATAAASQCRFAEDKPRVLALNCYLVALLLVLELLINFAFLRFGPPPRQLVNVVVYLVLGYAAVLLCYGLGRLWHRPEFDHPTRVFNSVVEFFLVVSIGLACLLCETFGLLVLNVARTEPTISMEFLGPVVDQPRAKDPAGDQRSRFAVVLRNRSTDTVALTPDACRVPKRLADLFRLSTVDWSAPNRPVLLIPPGKAAWIQFEATHHGKSQAIPPELECRVGGEWVSYNKLTADEIGSARP